MSSFWSQFLLDASPFENCAVITRDGHRYTTHKLLAARYGFLQSLLSQAVLCIRNQYFSSHPELPC